MMGEPLQAITGAVMWFALYTVIIKPPGKECKGVVTFVYWVGSAATLTTVTLLGLALV